ncbi:Eco57I restriction-modification methylase domain-containing protein [Enterococcus asini]|uniref:Eco57I restriction-modification methylase domain-containing protein n=1 Tax=Enterococcus asini TaxID=57732 RepID=UPI0028925E45|nr:Eco57I restriction-modification methylase domain-containing protein [Enterococcus asini]MDT2758077.1 Eco57I restriction-modification methylase domain-containing protein [Enterococcus asini]
MINLVDYIIDLTNKYMNQMSKDIRKKKGQFFTGKETALFMASLFDFHPTKEEVSILDPGAGSGILTAAFIQTLISKTNVQRINITCYETDQDVIGLLHNNLKWMKDNSKVKISYKVIEDNYIVSQSFEYNGLIGANLDPIKYDYVISNPPYKKIGKSSGEASSMPDICYGSPNLYFLFMQMGVFNLKAEGELVFIVPRSWTSGAYFKRFREKFLSEVVLEHIHLFVSRDKVFEQETVLQETIIIKARKVSNEPESVKITTTNGNSDFSDITIFEASYNMVVSGDHKYVFLLTCQDEVNIIKKVSMWKNTLPEMGLKMRTGLTVDFRNKEVLRNSDEKDAVPLFYSQHIQDGKVVFPVGKENEYIMTNQKGLLQNNENYLFVKRFTSKEEKRRLQCGVYLANKFPEYPAISTQNKLNFITGIKELSDCIVCGLYVVFNSTIYDNYYRLLNGSTQVNSTEINSMPVPPLDYIERMGRQLISINDMSVETSDNILGRFMNE